MPLASHAKTETGKLLRKEDAQRTNATFKKQKRLTLEREAFFPIENRNIKGVYLPKSIYGLIPKKGVHLC